MTARTKRVLLVEDSTTCALVLAAQLRRDPVRAFVTLATTLQKARDALAILTYDAVILDLSVGGEDGASLLPLPCPVLVVTAEPERAPIGYRVVAKGPRWAAAACEFVRALP